MMCRHTDSLWGRCVFCGMTWKEQADATEDYSQCDWMRGPDPASGCDSLADGRDGLCAKHRAAYASLSILPEIDS